MTTHDDPRPSTAAGHAHLTGPGERIIRVGEVDLCAQTFGSRTDPPILLIAGTACSMDWWEDELCERLAAGARFVIRYDHRDTGRSVSYEPGAPPYALRDLVTDAIGLLDALEVGAAHMVGMSMGGWIAQLAALDHPDRVASLVLISTRPTPHGPSDADLPDISERLRAVFAEEAAAPDCGARHRRSPVPAGQRARAGTGDPRRPSARARRGGPRDAAMRGLGPRRADYPAAYVGPPATQPLVATEIGPTAPDTIAHRADR